MSGIRPQPRCWWRRGGEYLLDADGEALRIDRRWVALAGELGLPAGRSPSSGVPLGTVFCHERQTPDGRRRLVVLEGRRCTVIEPGVWPVGESTRVARREGLYPNEKSDRALATVFGLTGPSHMSAGVPDPADPTRFTVPFVNFGISGTFEYRLGNDDRVTVRLLDPESFLARVNAAKLQAATQPPL